MASETSDSSNWILLTVPHANCPANAPEASHLCDSLSNGAAECIYEEKLLGNKVRVLKPFIPVDTPRTICDLNRKNARENPYRKGLLDFVKSNTKEILFVLDVHSYPDDHEPWKDYLLVVLDDSVEGRERPEIYSEEFVRFMNSTGTRTLLARGKNNDIHEQMRENGKKSFLLEFNEALTADRERLREICRFVLLWFNTLVPV